MTRWLVLGFLIAGCGGGKHTAAPAAGEPATTARPSGPPSPAECDAFVAHEEKVMGHAMVEDGRAAARADCAKWSRKTYDCFMAIAAYDDAAGLQACFDLAHAEQA